MSYLDEVYFNRLGLHGRTRQERLISRAEDSFTIAAENSLNKVIFNYNGKEITGILSSEDHSEYNLYSILKVPNGNIIPTGEELNLRDGFWLTMFHDKYLLKGYSKHTLLNLDKIITWKTEEGIEKTSHIYLVNNTKVKLEDMMKSLGKDIYFESDTSFVIVMKEDIDFKKNTYFELGNRGWRVDAFNNVTISNVAFCTIGETLVNSDISRNKPTSGFWSDS